MKPSQRLAIRCNNPVRDWFVSKTSARRAGEAGGDWRGGALLVQSDFINGHVLAVDGGLLLNPDSLLLFRHIPDVAPLGRLIR